ncbi:hypothetical protein [Alkalibacillus almallahensis]|uniref:hypothetical protein n=1 Tax=Alkalibacillus almallahensis TaxID=1379154 RepID=UPI00141E75C9|nr:hypothetical protein [Alkalibacillus almallahensis]NIK11166.1 hypothetical protein [Alkalibacillus almallahensis]
MSRIIDIPHDYKWMAKQAKEPGAFFKRYVAAYVRHNHPGYELVKINKMKAEIKKVNNE